MKRLQRVFGDFDSLRFVDGRLDDERRAAFLSHLEEDVAEAERIAVWARQNEMLRAAFNGVALEPVPVALRLSHLTPALRPVATAAPEGRPTVAQALPPPRIPQRVQDPSGTDVAYLQATGRPATRRPIGRGYKTPLAAAVLFASALLILYIAHDLLPLGAAPVPEVVVAADGLGPSTLLARAIEAHATYALDPGRPVEFTAGQVTPMKAWFQRRIGLGITPPKLAPEGWSLLGGRLVPGAGSPGALFVYEDGGGERLSVFVQRATLPVAAVSLGSAAEQGLSTMSWSSGSITYVITVGHNLDWLSRNGEDLRDRIMQVD